MTKVVIYRPPDATRLHESGPWLARLGRPALQLNLEDDNGLGVLLIIDDFKSDQEAIDRLAAEGNLELYDSWDARVAH